MEIKINAKRLAMHAVLRLLRKNDDGSFYIERTSESLVASFPLWDKEDPTHFEVYVLLGGIRVAAKGNIVGNQIHSVVSVYDYDDGRTIGSEALDLDIETARFDNEFGDMVLNKHL